MNETDETLVGGGHIAQCIDCGKKFVHYIKGTPQKRCPICTDKKQVRPSVVQERQMLNLYEAVQIESLPAEWQEVPPQHHGDSSHYKMLKKGSSYGAAWSGRIDIFASEPFAIGDVVNVREMLSKHLIRVVSHERQTMQHGTVTELKEVPVTESEGEETIRERKYLVFERASESTEAQARLVYAAAHTKTTLKGLGRQYWASAETDATIAHWTISGGVRSGRAHTTGVLAIVSEDHPLYIKKTGDIEGEECYK